MTTQDLSPDEPSENTVNIPTITSTSIKQSTLMKLSSTRSRISSTNNRSNVSFLNAPTTEGIQQFAKISNTPRAMSQPAVYTENLSNTLPENKKDSPNEIIDQSNLSELNNSTPIPLNVPNKKPPFYNSDDQSLDHRTAVQKKYSSLSMSASMTNKMPVTRTREMAIGGRRINNRHTAKININGKKVHVGIGFPTNAPVIETEGSKILKDTEKSYESFEAIIQKLKTDNSTYSSTLENRVKEKTDEKSEPKDQNELLTENDLTKLSNEIGTTKKKFMEMEKTILDDVNNIRSSIDKLMQDRKELQQKHKVWLEDRKKKIFQAKAESKKIGNVPYIGTTFKQQQLSPQAAKA